MVDVLIRASEDGNCHGWITWVNLEQYRKEGRIAEYLLVPTTKNLQCCSTGSLMSECLVKLSRGRKLGAECADVRLNLSRARVSCR